MSNITNKLLKYMFGCRLPLLSARPAVTSATSCRAATNLYRLVMEAKMGVNNLLKAVAQQHRGREWNPRPLDRESNALTIRLPSHPAVA